MCIVACDKACNCVCVCIDSGLMITTRIVGEQTYYIIIALIADDDDDDGRTSNAFRFIAIRVQLMHFLNVKHTHTHEYTFNKLVSLVN